MDFRTLVENTRSYRRFKQDPISRETLAELVELARTSASGGNNQPLKYFLSADAETNAKIFPTTIWAGALKDWDGPAESERPTGYVVILLDRDVSNGAGVDHGISGWSICLGAQEKGIGACMIGSIRREDLVQALSIPEQYQVMLIVALGVPGETVVMEDLPAGKPSAYYRDEASVHHVPKRMLDDVIVEF